MPRHDPAKTPPESQRAAKGTRLATHEIGLDEASASALAFLIERLKAHPEKGYPANKSGVARLGLQEAAKARGWKPPEEGS
ncbi:MULTISPECIES: hypothetical protein [Myxococcus]|uniref:hypothetical protein n=1 Tax=Myxococcus TaxID=32 RepID=UPI001142518D|nr:MULTISPECIES: hypothetical protein [Myxococcus]NOK05800.1 hypothetical protein [Myxococcus xanthus]